MTMHTASEGISFARELETTSAECYEELARRFPDHAETFSSYAATNRKHVSNVQRAYYGVITDAIEGCYAFNLNADDFALSTAVKDGAARAEAIKQARQPLILIANDLYGLDGTIRNLCTKITSLNNGSYA